MAATLRAAGITATGKYLPDYVLTNHELEQMVDTNDAWIRERTGIEERRILKGDKGSAFMATEAVRQLLNKRGLAATDIDLLICCTITPDQPLPATANLITANLGATKAWGFDMAAACSGFLYGLTMAAQVVRTGLHSKVVVVGVDKMSSIINYEDRNTCVIFGDGAAAVLVEPVEEGLGMVDAELHSDGQGAEFLYIPDGGSLRPASTATVARKGHYVVQEGRQVFKNAVTEMGNVTEQVMTRNNLTANEVDWLVPHQANKRIIDAVAKRVNLAPEKVMMNIQRYGNTTSGTLPLLLADYEPQMKRGDKVLFASFGGGFTWGATYWVWAYNGADVPQG